MNFKTKVKKAIEQYTGREVTSISIIADPITENAYAIRSTHLEGSNEELEIVCEWLISNVTNKHTIEQLERKLEEMEWTTWPPTVGEPKFFF